MHSDEWNMEISLNCLSAYKSLFEVLTKVWSLIMDRVQNAMHSKSIDLAQCLSLINSDISLRKSLFGFMIKWVRNGVTYHIKNNHSYMTMFIIFAIPLVVTWHLLAFI